MNNQHQKNQRQIRGHRAWTTGHRAEAVAALILRLKGYRIIARRFSCPLGEVDLIARRGRTLVFAEVKSRTDRALAAETITVRQRGRIFRTAEVFLQRHPRYKSFEARFDAILFGGGAWPRHISDAWRSDH